MGFEHRNHSKSLSIARGWTSTAINLHASFNASALAVSDLPVTPAGFFCFADRFAGISLYAAVGCGLVLASGSVFTP